ncbi:MAG: FAD-dependent oxidoreductase [Leptonema sp. (in: Bacteria)]|nr:FAD-dependent oxidoreductase [Leptonema sp. (in: bacteria)]
MAKTLKNSTPKTIVIIGATLAGPTAAARVRELDEEANIILLERNTRVSYAVAGLSLHLSGEVKSLDSLNKERQEFFKQAYNIDVRTGTEVEQIDAKKKTILIRSNGITETLYYDSIIYATGAAAVHPPKIKEAENLRYFRTLDDLAAIKLSLKWGKKRFVILGGGSMGAEALDGLVRGGADVTLIEREPHFLPEYSQDIADIAASQIGKKGRIIAGVKELDFEESKGKITSVIADGQKIKTDFVIAAIGLKPRTELLKKIGVKLNQDGTVVIDKYCQTSIANIYACGVCVSLPQMQWVAQAALSDKTAQIAGENVVNKNKASISFTSASQIIRLPEALVGRVGLTYKQAVKKYGKSAIDSVLIYANDKEPYYPKSARIAVKLFYIKKKQQLISVEIIGQDIKSQLDTFSAALAGKLRLTDLALLDLAYTPASATARDALNVAATVALQKENGITATISYDDLQKSRTQYFVIDVSAKSVTKKSKDSDMQIQLEQLRSKIDVIQEKFKASTASKIITVSKTGRRGHLALRILKSAGLPVVNLEGGERVL